MTQLAADAERVYRRLQGAVGGDVPGAAGGATTDRRAIAVLTQIMKPQKYRLPVVRPSSQGNYASCASHLSRAH